MSARKAPAEPERSHTRLESVKVARIRTDGGTQVRIALDEETVISYAEALAAGAKFPPVELVDDGKALWLVDGFHRRAAHIRAKRETIEAVVLHGTLEHARWLACARNGGLERCSASKRNAVVIALQNPSSAGLSDREIARHARVSGSFVANVRETVQAPTARKGKDGKVYPAPAALVDAAGTVVPPCLVKKWHALTAIHARLLPATEACRDQLWKHATFIEELEHEPTRVYLRSHSGRERELGDGMVAWVDLLKPYLVCDTCAGTGGSKDKPSCRRCSGCGWLSRPRVENREEAAMRAGL